MNNVVKLGLLAVVLGACGGATQEASGDGAHQGGAHQAGGHQAGGHDTGHGNAEHGHHGHHDHSSPEALRPLMRDLYASMLTLRGALEAGQVADAAAPAHAIAVACDDQDVHNVDAAQFGPRFAEIDGDLHRLAAAMAERTEAGELEAMRQSYATLQETCVGCHAQAPTASEVDLSGLTPTW